VVRRCSSGLRGTASSIPQELQVPVHRSYIKRQLHPLVLCSPFVLPHLQKPLGYAGDYEMVSMMLRDPYEGSSMFAKVAQPPVPGHRPVVAHRNRIIYLKKRLHEETERMAAAGQSGAHLQSRLRSGPGDPELPHSMTDFATTRTLLLLDFNDETITNTTRELEILRTRHRRRTGLKLEKRSVHQILKDSSRAGAGFEVGELRLVYCAGLFDYLSDRICRRLLEVFYDLLAPGGLLVATNVDSSNPSRVTGWSTSWTGISFTGTRSSSSRLAPDKRRPGSLLNVSADVTGVNIFLEVRKPAQCLRH
jgi:extracellular factor (EF) 3-hydroxypalmitic acid methyl ester biosynthesis protein